MPILPSKPINMELGFTPDGYASIGFQPPLYGKIALAAESAAIDSIDSQPIRRDHLQPMRLVIREPEIRGTHYSDLQVAPRVMDDDRAEGVFEKLLPDVAQDIADTLIALGHEVNYDRTVVRQLGETSLLFGGTSMTPGISKTATL